MAAATVFSIRNLDAWYGTTQALHHISLTVQASEITAIIGPSGCGKSTLLRCLNRINDVIAGFRTRGEVLFKGRNLFADDVDVIEVRRLVGMVFQRPNPFPQSIYANVAYGPRLAGVNDRARLDERVEA